MDEIVEKLPEEFNMIEIMAKVPPEERTPYVLVAFQECERMNMLTNEIRRSLKELDLGLKVSTDRLCIKLTWAYSGSVWDLVGLKSDCKRDMFIISVCLIPRVN